MLRKTISALVLGICVLGYSLPGYAIEWLDDAAATLEDNLDEGAVMGAGIWYRISPYKGMDNTIIPVPIIIGEYDRFFIDRNVAGFNLLDDEAFKVSVIAGLHMNGYDASDSNDFAGMNDRDWGFDGGLRLQWNTELAILTVTGVHDLSSTYEGGEVSVGVSKKLFEGFLTPRIGATWSSEDAVDYYYGVRSSEAAAGRLAYKPDSTINYALGLTVAVPLGEKWAVIGDVQYEFLGSEIKDSPIVDQDGLMRFTLGTVYRF